MVLPEPDSPTTPTVSPARTRRETPSTALTWPVVRRSRPSFSGNQTFSGPASTSGVGVGRDRVAAALRLGGDQAAGVVVLRVREHLRDRPGLDDPALQHHADPGGDALDDAEIVGDEQHRHAEPLLQVGQQRQDLRLHGHVEGGGRLVGDEQVRLAGERHRDHHPLALAAGELVRVGAHAPRRVAQADEFQQFEDARARRLAGEAAVEPQHLADLPLDACGAG